MFQLYSVVEINVTNYFRLVSAFSFEFRIRTKLRLFLVWERKLSLDFEHGHINIVLKSVNLYVYVCLRLNLLISMHIYIEASTTKDILEYDKTWQNYYTTLCPKISKRIEVQVNVHRKHIQFINKPFQSINMSLLVWSIIDFKVLTIMPVLQISITYWELIHPSNLWGKLDAAVARRAVVTNHYGKKHRERPTRYSKNNGHGHELDLSEWAWAP